MLRSSWDTCARISRCGRRRDEGDGADARRVTPRRAFESYVAAVAPQVEPIPKRHLHNPNVEEWGIAVQIVIPPEAELRPGELVDLIFWPKD
jgi:hypothetical protein